MKKLMARRNQEGETRVFEVEERDDCLILTKRLPPISDRVMPTFGLTLIFMLWGWRIFAESPVSDPNWLALIVHVVIGLTLLLLPIWEIWRAFRGDVWVFDSRNQQIKHSRLLIMSLTSLEKVEIERIEDSESPDYFRLFITSKKGMFELLDQNGSASEYLKIGQRIANFAQVPLVRPKNQEEKTTPAATW